MGSIVACRTECNPRGSPNINYISHEDGLSFSSIITTDRLDQENKPGGVYGFVFRSSTKWNFLFFFFTPIHEDKP